MCIMYTHFGKGFVENGKLDPEFSRLTTRLSSKNGWFAPVSALLDHLHSIHGTKVISPIEVGHLESRWLMSKLLHGTS